MLLRSAEWSKKPLNLCRVKKKSPITSKHGMGILGGAALPYSVTTPRSMRQIADTLPDYYPGCEIWCGWRIPLRFQFK